MQQSRVELGIDSDWQLRMSPSQDFSFAIMNGECRVTPESIDFAYDRRWRRLEHVFGKPSWRRSVVIALCVGLPLICIGGVCIAIGLDTLAAYPFVFGLFLLLAPFLTLFSEEYVYPDSIARNNVEEVTGSPPGAGSLGRLGSFTITFLSDGQPRKTMFCLPYGSSKERVSTYQAVAEAFAHAGLLSDSAIEHARKQEEMHG